jgi:hypothetical protein
MCPWVLPAPLDDCDEDTVLLLWSLWNHIFIARKNVSAAMEASGIASPDVHSIEAVGVASPPTVVHNNDKSINKSNNNKAVQSLSRTNRAKTLRLNTLLRILLIFTVLAVSKTVWTFLEYVRDGDSRSESSLSNQMDLPQQIRKTERKNTDNNLSAGKNTHEEMVKPNDVIEKAEPESKSIKQILQAPQNQIANKTQPRSEVLVSNVSATSKQQPIANPQLLKKEEQALGKIIEKAEPETKSNKQILQAPQIQIANKTQPRSEVLVSNVSATSKQQPIANAQILKKEEQALGKINVKEQPRSELGMSNVDTRIENTNKQPAIKIGHMVSFARCGPRLVQLFSDAMLVLRHSIHKQSVHNNNNTDASTLNKYDYQMYAVLHQDGNCEQYAERISQLGYKTLLRPTPVNISAIENKHYRTIVVSPNSECSCL